MGNRTYHTRGVPVHGYAVQEHPLYRTWAQMVARCTNQNTPGYENYGGRGIRVVSRWFHFENFAVDMWPKPDSLFTLERVDNDKGYSKSNCRWATRTDQCLNRRTFKNNSSGFRGVVPVDNGRFEARFHFEHVRYTIGRFATASAAARAQSDFVELFFTDRQKAVDQISGDTLWCTSSTKARGVTRLGDSNFIARATVNGVRHYIGYFSTIEAANDARTRFLAK